jgi:hypothetical protein
MNKSETTKGNVIFSKDRERLGIELVNVYNKEKIDISGSTIRRFDASSWPEGSDKPPHFLCIFSSPGVTEYIPFSSIGFRYKGVMITSDYAEKLIEREARNVPNEN